MGIYVWHVICMCMLSHSITKHKKNGPDVLGFPNFTTLVKNYKLGFNYLFQVEILALSASLKVSSAQNSFWAWIVTPYNFRLMAQSKSQLENIFLGPIFNFWYLMVQNNFWARLGLWAQSHWSPTTSRKP